MNNLKAERKAQDAPEVFHRKTSVSTAFKLRNVHLLIEENRAEVLNFLAKRPVHTVVMSSFIQDNGIESLNNRGSFYAYRDDSGEIEGIALIGHTTLIETKSNVALKAFAHVARKAKIPIHIMMSDGTTVEVFWTFYAAKNQKPRLVCTELLFELSLPALVQKCEWNIRLAKPEEVLEVGEAHAEVAFIESGVDPMTKDREGFLKRCLKRIEKNRTFVVFRNGKLVFKADIAAETDKVVYLEGIYVSPEYRGKGVASSCLSKLSLDLLTNRSQYICLLSNLDFENAHRSFLKAGFKNTDFCQTIFV